MVPKRNQVPTPYSGGFVPEPILIKLTDLVGRDPEVEVDERPPAGGKWVERRVRASVVTG